MSEAERIAQAVNIICTNCGREYGEHACSLCPLWIMRRMLEMTNDGAMGMEQAHHEMVIEADKALAAINRWHDRRNRFDPEGDYSISRTSMRNQKRNKFGRLSWHE